METAGGGCSCGAIRFELSLPTLFCAHCHCDTCRKAHGAAFVTWVGVPSERLALIDGDARLRRWTTETGATRSFCSRCGTTMLYEGPRWPGEIHVALGTVDDSIDRAPDRHVYLDHRAAWCEIDDGLARYGGASGGERLDGGG